MHWYLMYNDASHDDNGVLGRLFEESEKSESFVCTMHMDGNAPGTLYFILGKPWNLSICSAFTEVQCFDGHQIATIGE